MKLAAIMGGGDWADASVDHLLIPDDMKLEVEKDRWNWWYQNVYVLDIHVSGKVRYISFTDWLKQHGAKEATENEIIEFWDD